MSIMESNGERQMLTLKRQPDRVIRATDFASTEFKFGFPTGWICSSISIIIIIIITISKFSNLIGHQQA